MNLATAAASLFGDLFGSPPDVMVRSPGRVNLIGDHTDYNEGFVLPMAIDREVWVALRPREGRIVKVFADHDSEWCEFSLDDHDLHEGWRAYVEGIAHELGRDSVLEGWEGVIVSDLAIGAGLSSSAALELAVARAFSEVSALPWDPVPMALAAQRAESAWVGVECGIMDQLISACAEPGHAMLLDCRTLESRAVPIPQSVAVVVLDTATRRDLVDSAYNDRRASCLASARTLGVRALRDIDEDALDARLGLLSPIDLRRARHVVRENASVHLAARALADGDVGLVGDLMNQSHASMRDDFEVSTPVVDAMVDAAQSVPGCFGARMTGAGFGGAVVALVDRDHLDAFQETVLAEFRVSTGVDGSAFSPVAVGGTSLGVPEDRRPQ